MPIICVEGPPAVGKTTVSLELEDTYSCYTISAVNLKTIQLHDIGLMGWQELCEEQMDRWELAVRKSAEHAVVVLDGDIFWPLFLCGFINSPYKTQINDMFQQAFMEKKLGIPDRYFYLYASEQTLRRRAVTTLSPSITYTTALEDLFYEHRGFYRRFSRAFPGSVYEIQAAHERKAAQQIMKNIPSFPWDRGNIEKFQCIKQHSLRNIRESLD